MIFVVGYLILSLRFGIYNAETYAETFSKYLYESVTLHKKYILFLIMQFKD